MSGHDEAWQRVGAALAENWDFPVAEHERLHGGRNARTWRVAGPSGTAVAKLVTPGDADLIHFEGSLQVAAELDSEDLPTAAPLPSRDGHRVVPVGPGRLALLPWLTGRPLSGIVDADLDRMGAVLARLHRRAARTIVPAGIPAWPWSWLSLEALDLVPIEPGDAGLVERAASAATGPYPLGVVHGDPTPDNFLADGHMVGVIDWASVMQGPLRYDLAVLALASERAGARPDQIDRLVASYEAAIGDAGARADGPVGRGAEANGAARDRELPRMRALRLAAEIVYFTSRLRRPAAAIADVDEDLAGLALARAALRELD